MKTLSFVVLTSFVLLFSYSAMAQDPAMEAMMKLASPGDGHKELGKMVGEWTYSSKMWMVPDQPPAESNGTMHAEWILGGRFIHSVWKGEFMGMPFEGHGTDGYDNVSKQYVSSWVDNMGTGILHSTGTCDAAKKTCTSSGEMIDPMTNSKVTTRGVSTWTDDNTFTLEMYAKDASGKETKNMEMTVKRSGK